MNRDKWHPGYWIKHKESSPLLYWQNFQKQNSLWIRNSICTAKNFYLLRFKNESQGWKGGGQVFHPCRILLLSLSHASRDSPPWQQCFSPVFHLPLAKKKVIFPFVLGSNPISTVLASFPVLAIPDWFNPSTESWKPNPLLQRHKHLGFQCCCPQSMQGANQNHKHRQHRGTQADGGG